MKIVKDIVCSHLSDVASVEKAIAPTRGLVLFASPEWALGNAMLCAHAIRAMRRGDGLFGLECLHKGLPKLVGSNPAFISHGSDKNFIMDCIYEDIAPFLVDLADKSLFFDALGSHFHSKRSRSST
eukprot:1373796-Prymnesium_polylepis.1